MSVSIEIKRRNTDRLIADYKLRAEYLGVYKDKGQEQEKSEMMLVDEAGKLCSTLREEYPNAREQGFSWNEEKNQPVFPEAYKKAQGKFIEAGFRAINASKEAGGKDASYAFLYQMMQMMFDAFQPLALGEMVTQSILAMARDSQKIEAKKGDKADQDLIKIYKNIEKRIAAGELTGVMALTEPDGGSNLANGEMKCQIWKMPDGTVKVYGNKAYITGVNGNAVMGIVGHECNEKGEKQYNEDGSPKICTAYVPLNKTDLKTFETIDENERNHITRSKPLFKIGVQPQDLSVVTFDGAEGIYAGEKIEHMLGVMNPARLKVASQGIAHIFQAFDMSLKVACEKGLSAEHGIPIIERKAVLGEVLEMGSYYEILSTLTTRVGVMQEKFKDMLVEKGSTEDKEKRSFEFMAIPLLKAFCTQKGKDMLGKATDILAAEGFTNPDFAQMANDAMPAGFYEGTNHMQLRTVVKTGMQYMDNFLKDFKDTGDSKYTETIKMVKGQLKALDTAIKAYTPDGVDDSHPFAKEAGEIVGHALMAVEAVNMHKFIEEKLKGDVSREEKDVLETKQITLNYFLKQVLPKEVSAMGKVDSFAKRAETIKEDAVMTPEMKNLVAKNKEDLRQAAESTPMQVGQSVRLSSLNLVAYDGSKIQLG